MEARHLISRRYLWASYFDTDSGGSRDVTSSVSISPWWRVVVGWFSCGTSAFGGLNKDQMKILELKFQSNYSILASSGDQDVALNDFCVKEHSLNIAPKKLTSTFSSQPSQQQMDSGEPFAIVRSEGPFPSSACQNFGAANEARIIC